MGGWRWRARAARARARRGAERVRAEGGPRLRRRGVDQILQILHVDLHVAQPHLARRVGRREQNLESAPHDALEPRRRVAQRVRLARAGLAVAHDAAVDALERRRHHVGLVARRGVHLRLTRRRRQRTIEDELARRRRALVRLWRVGVGLALEQPQLGALAVDRARAPRALRALERALRLAHGGAHSHEDAHARRRVVALVALLDRAAPPALGGGRRAAGPLALHIVRAILLIGLRALRRASAGSGRQRRARRSGRTARRRPLLGRGGGSRRSVPLRAARRGGACAAWRRRPRGGRLRRRRAGAARRAGRRHHANPFGTRNLGLVGTLVGGGRLHARAPLPRSQPVPGQLLASGQSLARARDH